MEVLRCPECGSTKIITERRLDGNHTCMDCHFVWKNNHISDFRPEQRIKPFMARMLTLWKKNPELRFTQIFFMIEALAKEKFNIYDIFYLTDEQILEVVDELIKHL